MQTVRFLDQFTVLLFDLHGTLMFGQDRFGPTEDYFSTYQALGGTRLDRQAVTAAIETCFAGLSRDYRDPQKFESFPTLAEALEEYAGSEPEDVELLEQVFAAHERGDLPATHVAFLQRVSETHELGVVSNICAPPRPWITAFADAGVRELFKCLIFSSEGRCIKPSPAIFRRALAHFPSDARVLFVGDSLERDIEPARALGMATAWVSTGAPSSERADVTISSVLSLESIAA